MTLLNLVGVTKIIDDHSFHFHFYTEYETSMFFFLKWKHLPATLYHGLAQQTRDQAQISCWGIFCCITCQLQFYWFTNNNCNNVWHFSEWPDENNSGYPVSTRYLNFNDLEYIAIVAFSTAYRAMEWTMHTKAWSESLMRNSVAGRIILKWM